LDFKGLIGVDNKEQVITTETVIKQVRLISFASNFRWKLGTWNAIVKLLQAKWLVKNCCCFCCCFLSTTRWRDVRIMKRSWLSKSNRIPLSFHTFVVQVFGVPGSWGRAPHCHTNQFGEIKPSQVVTIGCVRVILTEAALSPKPCFHDSSVAQWWSIELVTEGQEFDYLKKSTRTFT